MAGFTEGQILGTNAVQDEDIVTIAKEDLVSVGFVATESNDGEAIFAGIIFQAYKLGLTTDSRDGTDAIEANPNQQVAIAEPTTLFINRQDSEGNPIWVKRDSYTIDFDTLLPSGTTPNAY